ncbi:hypothetical protein P8452_22046 [Trifolium repens]|nr:hypothetical protein P8452_22046 [Trifolium repens]
MTRAHETHVSSNNGSTSAMVKNLIEENYKFPYDADKYDWVEDKVAGVSSCYTTSELLLDLNVDVGPSCSWSLYLVREDE